MVGGEVPGWALKYIMLLSVQQDNKAWLFLLEEESENLRLFSKLQKQIRHRKGLTGTQQGHQDLVLVAEQTHTYSSTHGTAGFSGSVGWKGPHLFSFQAKWVQCFTNPPLYNQVHCYLFCWQLLVLLACQRKAKTTRSIHWANGMRREDSLKTKTDWVAFSWEAQEPYNKG